ncbi:TPA: hypothetical protein LSG62_004489 [Serratia liquefaciens]|nr:hypothetical protein [Serratia liquefaciens]
MNVEDRLRTEREIAVAAVKGLVQAGYQISVFDGEEVVNAPSNDADSILGDMFSTDIDQLEVFNAGDHVNRAGWVLFVYGNDGWDVICDHTTNLEGPLKNADELANKYAEQFI